MKLREFLDNTLPFDKEIPFSKYVPALVLSVSLAVTYQLWKTENDTVKDNSFRDFSVRKDEIRRRIEEQMNYYGYTLRWSRALFAGGMDRRKEFHNFVRDLDIEKKYPGAVGYSFMPLIKNDAINGYVQKLRNEGCSDYAVFPSGIRQEYAPIAYIEPSDHMENMKALGYDSFSDPKRRSVMELSRDRNSIHITEKVHLTQDPDSKPKRDFLMYLPVYRNGAPYSTVEERRENIAGWLAAPIRMTELMDGIIKNDLFSGLDVEIYDGTVSMDTLFFDSDNVSRGVDKRYDAVFQAVESIEIFWHSWTFVVHSLPGFEAKMDNRRADIILSFWLGISFFLALSSWLIIREKRMLLRVTKNMKKMNIELIKNEERLNAIIEANMDAIIEMDGEGRIIGWGWQAENIFGWKKNEVLGKFFIEVILSEYSPENYADIFSNFIATARESCNTKGDCNHNHKNEFSAVRKDKTEFFAEITVASIHGKGEQEFCAFARNITERKVAAMKILEMATHDALTGLPNRTLLTDRLEQAIRISERSGNCCAVLFLDLDRFKPVNDTFWHEVGDILLKEVAERLEAITRAEDTVARFWGDEFVLVISGLKSESDVNPVAEKIIRTLSAPFYINKQEISIGASVGISLFPRDATNVGDLLKTSDAAMYHAKSSGNSWK